MSDTVKVEDLPSGVELFGEAARRPNTTEDYWWAHPPAEHAETLAAAIAKHKESNHE